MQLKKQLTDRRGPNALRRDARECERAGYPGIAEVLFKQADLIDWKEAERQRKLEAELLGDDDEE